MEDTIANTIQIHTASQSDIANVFHRFNVLY